MPDLEPPIAALAPEPHDRAPEPDDRAPEPDPGAPEPDDRAPELLRRPPPASVRPSPLESALDRVGDRWSLLVVEALLDGPRRFGELQSALPSIAPNILTDRLRRLDRAGIVRSTPYQDRPTRLAYELTGDGRDLASALRLLADWGARRADGADAPDPLRHDACGTPLEAHWYCPTCAIAIGAADAPAVRRV